MSSSPIRDRCDRERPDALREFEFVSGPFELSLSPFATLPPTTAHDDERYSSLCKRLKEDRRVGELVSQGLVAGDERQV